MTALVLVAVAVALLVCTIGVWALLVARWHAERQGRGGQTMNRGQSSYYHADDRNGDCPKCGYELGHHERCPWCGWSP